MTDMHSNDPLTERQIALEEESLTLGIERYMRARASKDETDLAPGKRLLRETVAPVVEEIRAFIADAESGKAGRRHSAVKWIAAFEPETLAILTAHHVINSSASGRAQRVQTVGLAVARAVEQEVSYKKFAEVNRGLYEHLQRVLKKATSAKYRKGVVAGAMSREHIEAFAFPANEGLQFGLKLVELFIAGTGLAEVVTNTMHGVTNARVEVRGTAKLLTWLEEAHRRAATFTPVRMPMLVPPRDWHAPYGGGYLTSATGRVPLVRTRNAAYLNELGNADMPLVYEGLNAMQKTPWAINTGVLDVMREAWEAGGGIGGLPGRDLGELPAKPQGLIEHADLYKQEHASEFKEWKRSRARVYEENARAVSKRVAAAQTLFLAQRFRDEAAIYFPHSLDFRGRAYPIPALLTPQGDDAAKALLRFAVGVPLGEEGANWLAIHIANCFGVDKVSFAARIAWTHENSEAILDSALSPLDGQRMWETADSPWQALAACMEWAGYSLSGAEYVSHLPIALDGSNNAIQNLSAMLRDKVGGAATNLVPAENPADIYTEVLTIAAAQVRKDAEAGNAAAIALDGTLTRKIVKRPCMTYCYGVTRSGMRGQILDEFRRAGMPDEWEAAEYLAGVLWACIGEVVVAAQEAMKWLKDVAKRASSGDMPVSWTTPAGFPVLQEYREQEGKRVNLHIGGRRVQLRLTSEGSKLDRRRQSLGISPNFVHSCDAAHMMQTIVLAHANGIEHFSMIHDSYATHAGNTGTLAAALRHAFVEQYSADVLGNFKAELEAQLPPDIAAEIPPLPPVGTLELSSVLDSRYFFA